MFQWKNGKLQNQEYEFRLYDEAADGKHLNKSLFDKAETHFKQRKWQNASFLFDELLTKHPHYYLSIFDNYTYSIFQCIQELISPYVHTNVACDWKGIKDEIMQKNLESNPMPVFVWGGTSASCFDACKLMKYRHTYKQIHSNYKRWIKMVKYARKYISKLKYVLCIGEARSCYSLFLRQLPHRHATYFHNAFKTFIDYKLYSMLSAQHVGFVWWCIQKGRLANALTVIEHIFSPNHKYEYTDFVTLDIFFNYFYCYVLTRYQKFKRAIKIWNKIERKYSFDTIEKTLFNIYRDNKRLYYLHTVHKVWLPNNAVLDLKINCFIAMEKFKEAVSLIAFYEKVWRRTDQIVYYEGYLYMCVDKIPQAFVAFKHVPMKWKTNQHYYCAMFYHTIKHYGHAKYHFIAALNTSSIPEYEPLMAEIYFHLSEILFESREYKLSKYFLNKAYKTTADIPCVASNFERMKNQLEPKLSTIQCANFKCNKRCFLKVCKGCGKKCYCSTKCQKYDWKYGQHRTKCDKSWCTLFKMIKTKEYIACSTHNCPLSMSAIAYL